MIKTSSGKLDVIWGAICVTFEVQKGGLELVSKLIVGICFQFAKSTRMEWEFFLMASNIK